MDLFGYIYVIFIFQIKAYFESGGGGIWGRIRDLMDKKQIGLNMRFCYRNFCYVKIVFLVL